MAYLTLVSFIWAFSFVLIKGVLSSLDSNFVSFARMLLSLAVFLPFLRPAGISVRERIYLITIGAVQFGLMYIAYIASYRYLPAHLVALLTTTTPIFVTLINDIITKRIHLVFFAAALLAVLAGIVIKYPQQSLSANCAGILLIQLSNIAFAFGQVAYAKLAGKNPAINSHKAFAFLYGGAVIATGAFSLALTDYCTLHVTGRQLFTLIYLGIIASGVCFFWWNKGAAAVNKGLLAIMNNLKIPLAIAASLIMLRENTDYIRLGIGCVLMFAAIVINEKFGAHKSI